MSHTPRPVRPASPEPEASGPSASDAVADGLRRAVLEHRLAPGTRLPEDEVGEIFGVSRTVVRAALLSLSHSGLVTLQRNRGGFIARPGIREAREVFEARALLEPGTARSAAERATIRDVATLRAHIEAEHAALDSGDAGRAVFLSGQFHMTLARIADQETIAGLIGTLVSRSSLIIALYWKRREALCESHAHHALVEAVAAHRGDEAEALMRAHIADLAAGLDLREGPAGAVSLREALSGRG
jgi:DNA-binding GntR family transcriptional regulator